ncbi:MAG: adenylosuccinate synthase [Phycisphaerae bacterium]|nr:adenylosuccinate synthase [Phycisphaerae bacterium]
MDFTALGNTCVLGMQWGDEGKGKIVDVLTEHFDFVVRYAGGSNAGHTVRIGDRKFALHLVPSGILRPDVYCVIAPGVVVDPALLVQEIDGLRAAGIRVGSNLIVSDRAHVVMPYHKRQDQLSEQALAEERKIGTTARGIGPCYADKMLRSTAIRMGDLLHPDRARGKIREIVALRSRYFAAVYGDSDRLDGDAISDEYLAHADRLRDHIADTTPILHDALRARKRLLFEGAQGSLLDVDHGTYPFVTSSNCGAGGVASGAGVPPRCLNSVVGVMKAYCTRVGGGPFPTELHDETGETIRRRGHEYGTTTGRPRRCGWFDAVAARYCVALGGVTELALMHLDTLGALPEIRVCTAYRHRGRMLEHFTPDLSVLDEVEPVYETHPGWGPESPPVTDYEQLPVSARSYVERLERLMGVPITLISVGADRVATVHRMAGFRMEVN